MDDLSKLLEHVDSIKVCPGVTDKACDNNLSNEISGKFGNATQVAQVVRDKCGFLHNRTIRHDDCPLIISDAHGCAKCSSYINVLRAMKARLSKSTEETSEARTKVDSKTPLSALKQQELLERACLLSREVKNTKLRMNHLMERALKEEVQSEGVEVGEEISQDLRQAMIDNRLAHLKEDSFSGLFWRQQMEALDRDQKGHRWNPMIIKWCFNLRLASRKGFETLRNSNALKIPGNTTLQSYVHWTNTTSGFTVDALKKLCQEMKISNEGTSWKVCHNCTQRNEGEIGSCVQQVNWPPGRIHQFGQIRAGIAAIRGGFTADNVIPREKHGSQCTCIPSPLSSTSSSHWFTFLPATPKDMKSQVSSGR